MEKFNKKEYIREYNKEAYKVLRVYIPVKEYNSILEHTEKKGYKSMSGYIKSLIDADMKKNIPAEE